MQYAPSLSTVVRREWFSNIRGDVLSGIVVALALIPEAIGFSIVAGVDPKVGLYASFCIAVVLAFTGGRPAMISAATGAMALLMVSLVRDHGIEYLFAATILTGAIQIVFGLLKLGRYMKFVPKAVMVGFVNALAILIFVAQLPQFVGAGPGVYLMVLAGLAIIYLFPLLTKVVPSPLIAIVALTAFTVLIGDPFPTVGDMGELPSTLPFFALPAVPLALETLMIILPYALPLALVGLIESLLTANLLDGLTDTRSDKNRESRGQGYGNIVAGLFGGMAGCAMIGQSVINVSSGGRTRLSTLVAGVFLMVLLLLLGDVLRVIPMAALVAVMVMVSINTFDWSSLRGMLKQPISETIIVVATVAVVVATHNLALGVILGILLASVFFARKVAQQTRVSSSYDESTRTRTYVIEGQMFFVSTEAFMDAIDTRETPRHLILDFSNANIWDATAVDAVEGLKRRFEARGAEVELIGVTPQAQELMQRLGNGRLTGDNGGTEAGG
ncbi:MAG TPA: SulP family inorganic anion transporter [Trueperaceae bacterium]|nr:SulP family inorganic anion transporter [Trueperaceae bacterium]